MSAGYTVVSTGPEAPLFSPARWVHSKNAAHLIRLLDGSIFYRAHSSANAQTHEPCTSARLVPLGSKTSPSNISLSREAYVLSTLPPENHRDHAERLCVELISEYHSLRLAKRSLIKSDNFKLRNPATSSNPEERDSIALASPHLRPLC